MSPKPGTVTTLTETISKDEPKTPVKHNVIPREDFLSFWYEKPYGLEQHIFDMLYIIPAHFIAVYYFYLNLCTNEIPATSVLFETFYGYLGGLGITVGCHRYWAHRTFKASTPLQIILMIMQTIAWQYPIHKWCLEHRIHHKYTETDSDPYNPKRGFWFSHIGWLFLPKRPELQDKFRTFDCTDLDNDPIVRFQSRWYIPLLLVLHYMIPMSVLHHVWNIPLLYCFYATCRIYVVSHHLTFCVNSFAHMWGDKPYDKNISSVDNPLVSLVAVGEGWHNYHHTFPWDYKASEFGWKINVSTMFIDFFASIGWAWDLKTVSAKLLQDRIRRTGDGSHAYHDHSDHHLIKTPVQSDSNELKCGTTGDSHDHDHPSIWGWGDDSIPDEFRKITKILRQK